MLHSLSKWISAYQKLEAKEIHTKLQKGADGESLNICYHYL